MILPSTALIRVQYHVYPNVRIKAFIGIIDLLVSSQSVLSWNTAPCFILKEYKLRCQTFYPNHEHWLSVELFYSTKSVHSSILVQQCTGVRLVLLDYMWDESSSPIKGSRWLLELDPLPSVIRPLLIGLKKWIKKWLNCLFHILTKRCEYTPYF